jgi:rhamnosyltransferase
MGRKPTVSIIIIEKNQKHFLENSLAMIFLQSYQGFEVIAVDSGSTDGTLKLLQKLSVKVVRTNQSNLQTFNYAQAKNEGIRASQGKYIAILSGDAVPTSFNWLKNLIRGLDGQDAAATNGSYIFSLKTDILHQLWFRPIFRFSRGGRPTSFTGANCAIKKGAWERYPFDEKYGPAEDAEWGKIITRGGFKIVFNRDASVFHQHWSGVLNNLRQILDQIEKAFAYLKNAY